MVPAPQCRVQSFPLGFSVQVSPPGRAGESVVHVGRELDLATRSMLTDACRSLTGGLVVDLAEVTFTDCCG